MKTKMVMMGLLLSQISDLTDDPKIKDLVLKGKEVIGEMQEESESKTTLKSSKKEISTHRLDSYTSVDKEDKVEPKKTEEIKEETDSIKTEDIEEEEEDSVDFTEEENEEDEKKEEPSSQIKEEHTSEITEEKKEEHTSVIIEEKKEEN